MECQKINEQHLKEELDDWHEAPKLEDGHEAPKIEDGHEAPKTPSLFKEFKDVFQVSSFVGNLEDRASKLNN